LQKCKGWVTRRVHGKMGYVPSVRESPRLGCRRLLGIRMGFVRDFIEVAIVTVEMRCIYLDSPTNRDQYLWAVTFTLRRCVTVKVASFVSGGTQ